MKKANGRMNAECLSLEGARWLITRTVKEAILNHTEIQPYKVTLPLTVAIEFYRSDMADWAEELPGSIRKSARIVEYTAPDVITANKAFRSMVGLAQM